MEPPRVCGWVPLCERPRPHTGHPDAAQPGGRRFRRTTPDVAVVQRSGGMVLRVCELRGSLRGHSGTGAACREYHRLLATLLFDPSRLVPFSTTTRLW